MSHTWLEGDNNIPKENDTFQWVYIYVRVIFLFYPAVGVA